MIECGWFYMDNAYDHLVHHALMTNMADLITGSNGRVPSLFDGVLEYV